MQFFYSCTLQCKNCQCHVHNTIIHSSWSICLLVSLFGIFHPTQEFFTHMETSQLLVIAANFDLCLALMANEQWGFFSVPHLLWHGHPFIMINSEDPWHSHLLLSIWLWSCHYLFLRQVCRCWDWNTQPSACKAIALTHCATAVVKKQTSL